MSVLLCLFFDTRRLLFSVVWFSLIVDTAVSSVTKVDYSSSGGGGSSTVNGRRRKQNVLPSFCHYVSFFQDVFETGRRHKISNPHHMRSDYGKMMFMLQDAQTAVHARTTGDEFSLVSE